jgi:uncharacterized DUF497 family protein
MTPRFVYLFDWDISKAMANWHKHGVGFEVAATVFQDPLALSRYDVEHSESEERWVTLGKVETGQLVVVVHTFETSPKKPGYGSSQLVMPRHMSGGSTRTASDLHTSPGGDHANRIRLLER